MFHRHSFNENQIFLENLKNIVGNKTKILLLQPVIYHKDQPKNFELLFYSEKSFYRYPVFEEFANLLISLGFKAPKRFYNLFMITEVKEGETSITIPSPPKYCFKCGKPVNLNAYFCPFCGAVLEYNFTFPLI